MHVLLFIILALHSWSASGSNLRILWTINPSVSKNVAVSVTIEDWKGGPLSFSFPNRYGPALEVWKHIKGLHVAQGSNALPYTIHQPEEQESNAQFLVEKTAPGPITISYDVTPPDLSESRITSVWNVIQPDHAVLKGASSLPRIMGLDPKHNRADLVFHSPNDWKVFCSDEMIDMQTCRIYFDDILPLTSSAFPVGAWERRLQQVGNLELEILRAGAWGMSFDEFAAILTKPLQWQLEKIGGHQRKKYQLINDTYPEDFPFTGIRNGGERLYSSTYSMVMRSLSLAEYRRYALNLPAHEFFHTFFENYDEGMTWLQEGFTDYMAYQSRYLSGAIDDFLRGKDIAEAIEFSYWNNNANKVISLHDASLQRWETPERPWTQIQIDSMLYRQVVLFGLVIDWIAAKSGSEKSMVDVIALLWSQFGQYGIAISEDKTFAAIESVLGPKVLSEFKHYLFAMEPLPLQQMLHDSGWILEEQTDPHLGFNVAEKDHHIEVRELSRGLNRDELQVLGIKLGDQILSVNMSPTVTITEFKSVLAALKIGESAELRILSQGMEMNIRVVVRPWRRVVRLERR